MLGRVITLTFIWRLGLGWYSALHTVKGNILMLNIVCQPDRLKDTKTVGKTLFSERLILKLVKYKKSDLSCVRSKIHKIGKVIFLKKTSFIKLFWKLQVHRAW